MKPRILWKFITKNNGIMLLGRKPKNRSECEAILRHLKFMYPYNGPRDMRQIPEYKILRIVCRRKRILRSYVEKIPRE